MIITNYHYILSNVMLYFAGWRRETIIRGLTKNGGIKGDVTYTAPDSTNKFKQMSDVTQVSPFFLHTI